MARTGFIDLDPADEDLFFSNLTAQNRFTSARVTRKVAFFSRRRVKGLTARSLLPQIAEAWNLLTDQQKTDWGLAGAKMGLNGYRLFVQDKSARIKNDIAGNATPSLLHQSWVGFLSVEAPATEIKIAQFHPRSYWVSAPVVGKKGMRSPVVVTEDLALPLEIELNYKSNLVSQGPGSFAKYYAVIRHSYQGIDRFTNLEIDLDLVANWKNAKVDISSVRGYIIGYTLYIHLYNLRGTLLCDNIKATHSSQNWVRDTYCKDIDQGFTHAFYQVPKHWVFIEDPAGASFGTIYPT